MNKDRFRLNVISVRHSLNLTQVQMAQKLGISRQAYINLENGKTAIINKQIIKMAECCDIPEEKIMFGYGPEEDKGISSHKEKLAFLTELLINELARLRQL